MSQGPTPEGAMVAPGPAPGIAGLDTVQLGNMPPVSREQLMAVIQNIPGLFPPKMQPGDKDDAAQILSRLGQFAPGSLPPGILPPGFPGVNEPGPSSHPRGPPNLGQLSVAALQANGQQLPQAPATASRDDEDEDDGGLQDGSGPTPVTTGGRRGRGGAAMGSDEWTRQRKDNHKEVERRRRGNINEGINELGRIVPNGSGEKAKGAILSRAVQYIHHLKENEARNIEKWTLEKLLMDQAMGDLQAQLEETRRLWEEDRSVRQRLEQELEVIRSGGSLNAAVGSKRPSEDGDGGDDAVKRQKTE